MLALIDILDYSTWSFWSSRCSTSQTYLVSKQLGPIGSRSLENEKSSHKCRLVLGPFRVVSREKEMPLKLNIDHGPKKNPTGSFRNENTCMIMYAYIIVYIYVTFVYFHGPNSSPFLDVSWSFSVYPWQATPKSAGFHSQWLRSLTEDFVNCTVFWSAVWARVFWGQQAANFVQQQQNTWKIQYIYTL